MAAYTLTVNGKTHTVDVSPDTPLLWVIRDHLELTGTKFGCGMGLCGACTVHLDGEATRSCVTRVSDAAGKKITTIEGLEGALGEHLRAAWIEEQVPQCGYCQSGQIMTAAGLLLRKPEASDQDIIGAMSDNICRCGTYQRIHAAIRRAAESAKGGAR